MRLPDITEQTILCRPSPTLLAKSVPDGFVVETAAGRQTIRGHHAALAETILRQSDGSTKIDEIAKTADEHTLQVAEQLYQAGLAYPRKLLSSVTDECPYFSTLETELLKMNMTDHETFHDTISDAHIVFRPEKNIYTDVLNKLETVGWEIDTGNTSVTPDVTVYIEIGGTDEEERKRVNQRWRSSGTTLIRIGYNKGSVEFGPVMTPSSSACLRCLTTRESMNTASESVDFDSVQPTNRWFQVVEHLLVRVLIQVVTGNISSWNQGQITIVDPSDLTSRRTQLFSLPGCSICGT